MTRINDIADLVEVLRAHPDWLGKLQDVLLAEVAENSNIQLERVLRRLEEMDAKLDHQQGAFYEARVAKTSSRWPGNNWTWYACEYSTGATAQRTLNSPDCWPMRRIRATRYMTRQATCWPPMS